MINLEPQPRDFEHQYQANNLNSALRDLPAMIAAVAGAR